MLDDDEGLSRYVKEAGNPSFGRLIQPDSSITALPLREVSNKIIHANGFLWDFSAEGAPVLVCQSKQPDWWLRAEIDLVGFAAFCGRLMH